MSDAVADREMPTRDLALMRLHVESLFLHDGDGRLVFVNESGGAPAPRFFLGRTVEGDLLRTRHDVAPELAAELRRLVEAMPPRVDLDVADARPLVSTLAPVHRTWCGPAFRFPAHLPSDNFAVRIMPANAAVLEPCLREWRADVETAAPMLAVLDGGKAVSLCCSVRVSPDAHEAGVETHPDFRGRGYAARAVSAWATAVRELGRVPFYSTSRENRASRTLAAKLGLIRFGVDLHIT